MHRDPAELTLLGTGALVVLALLGLGFDGLPFDLLGRIFRALLLWAAVSTLVVAALGAWVAVARTRRGRLRIGGHRQHHPLH